MSIEAVERAVRRREVLRRLLPLLAAVVAVAEVIALLSGAVMPHLTISFKAPVAPYRQTYVAAHYVWLGSGSYVIRVHAYLSSVKVSVYCTTCGSAGNSTLSGSGTLTLRCSSGLVIMVSALVPPYHSRVCDVEVSRVGLG